MLKIKNPELRTAANFTLLLIGIVLSFAVSRFITGSNHNDSLPVGEGDVPVLKESLIFVYVFVFTSILICGSWLVKSILSLKSYPKYGFLYKTNVALMLFAVFFLIPAVWFAVVQLNI